MIYEMVLRCVDDLRTRWTDFDASATTLMNALPVGDPMRVTIQTTWINPIRTVGTGPLAVIDAARPDLVDFPALAQLIADAAPIFDDSLGHATLIDAAATTALGQFVLSNNTAISTAATIARSRLDELLRLVRECIQEMAEITSDEGSRANLAGMRGAVDDISTYPVLTQEMGYPTGPVYPGGGGGGTPQAAPLLNLVDRTLSSVLGRRPRVADTNSFIAALNQSFTCEEVEGRTTCTWVPRAYAGATELGGTLSGAQASVYERARVTLDAVLPLLDKLQPLLPDFDPEDAEAVRSIVRTELTELVNELATEGGPRVLRVDSLFEILLGQEFVARNGLNINDPANAGLLAAVGLGEIGRLGDVYGLTFDQVNTLEEERDLTDYVILQDHVRTLQASWLTFRTAFLGQVSTFFGTQLVLLSRSLSGVAESVSEVAFAMDSVFLGHAERQVTQIEFPATVAPAPMLVQELLNWIESFASLEGPRIIQDGGKRGARTVVPTLQRLRQLVENADGRIRHPGARHPRVRRMLAELSGQLARAAQLAGTIR